MELDSVKATSTIAHHWGADKRGEEYNKSLLGVLQHEVLMLTGRHNIGRIREIGLRPGVMAIGDVAMWTIEVEGEPLRREDFARRVREDRDT